MTQEDHWLTYAIELQALAQSGLAYTKNPFERERYERIREIAAEMVSRYGEVSLDKVEKLFCNETGYQTPKLDTRAAIFKDGKILLVQENSGLWSLPGGWLDVDLSVRENTIKEVKEEAGLDVTCEYLIALHDRNKRNQPPYAYGICKVFVACQALGGSFQENSETQAAAYFACEDLPELDPAKNTKEQVAMCFEANAAETWEPIFD